MLLLTSRHGLAYFKIDDYGGNMKKFSREMLSVILIEWDWLCIMRARHRLERLEKRGKALSSEEVCKENSEISRHCVKLMKIYDRIT